MNLSYWKFNSLKVPPLHLIQIFVSFSFRYQYQFSHTELVLEQHFLKPVQSIEREDHSTVKTKLIM